MKIVIDIPENMDLRNYDIPYDILNIITSGISLPEHHERLIDKRGAVTNGDVIKTVFPSAEIDENKYTYVVCVKLPYHTQYDTGLLFDKDWWNSPYKECDKNDNNKV